LLILRLSLTVFLLQWSLEKIVAPQSAIQVAQHFYGVALTGSTVLVLGTAQVLLAFALLIGLWRRWNYALAIVVPVVSVGSTWRQLLNPYGPGGNHLFMQACRSSPHSLSSTCSAVGYLFDGWLARSCSAPQLIGSVGRDAMRWTALISSIIGSASWLLLGLEGQR